MGRVSRAAEAVSDVAVAALSAPPNANVLMVTLDCVRAVVGADSAGFYVHEREGWTTAVHLAPEEVWTRVPYMRIPTKLATAIHPGIRHLMRPATVQPFTITDLVTQREWLDSQLGRAMRPQWRRNYQLAIPVPAGSGSGAVMTWVLGRDDDDFTPSDRDVTAAVQPVLAAVARHNAAKRMSAAALRGAQATLTERELVVLTLLAEGMSPFSVGHRLGVSPRTVHKHAERIYRKLGARDRYSAVRAAAEIGLVVANAEL